MDRIVVTGNATPTVSTPIPDVTVNEDAANGTVNLRSFFNDAEDGSAGLTYTVQTNTNTGLVTTSINNSTDVLTLDYVDNASGTANITIRATDTGSLFVEDTFLVTVNAVNDAPGFTKGADQTVGEDAGAQTVNGWATVLSAGPANEAGQVLNFIVSNNNNALFSSQPTIAANGTLTFTPAANANGSATVSVQIHDNGGTANGGVDTSAAQTFTINVTAVNDAPSITAQSAAIALAQNQSRTIVFADLTVTDVDNPYPTGFTLTVQNGANYTRVANTITPTPGFVGTLSVPVRANDGTANSNVFDLVVTVNPSAGQIAANARIAPEPGGGFRVSFLGAPGASYTIQFTNSLAPANWQPLATVAAGSDGRYSRVDIPPANTPMRFYRSVEP